VTRRSLSTTGAVATKHRRSALAARARVNAVTETLGGGQAAILGGRVLGGRARASFLGLLKRPR
jgi:hypothetical protein